MSNEGVSFIAWYRNVSPGRIALIHQRGNYDKGERDEPRNGYEKVGGMSRNDRHPSALAGELDPSIERLVAKGSAIASGKVCSLTLQAFQGRAGPFQTGIVLPYEEISESRVEGKHLLINGSRFAKCATLEQAKSLVELIKRVSSESIEKREELIREFSLCSSRVTQALSHLAHVNDLAAECGGLVPHSSSSFT